jgi:DNA-binding XRE family transcriptional regulator
MVEMSRSDFAIESRLKIIRNWTGLSREDFSAAVGISKDQLYNYESYRTPMPCGVALRICRTFFFDEKWLAKCEVGQYRPGVDLMGHPDYLKIDPSAPFSEIYPKLESAYNELVQLPFYEMVDRHLKSCGNDRFRLKQFTEFMFDFYSDRLEGWAHAEIVRVALAGIRRYLEYNEAEYAFGKGIISAGRYNGIPGEEQKEP